MFDSRAGKAVRADRLIKILEELDGTSSLILHPAPVHGNLNVYRISDLDEMIWLGWIDTSCEALERVEYMTELEIPEGWRGSHDHEPE